MKLYQHLSLDLKILPVYTCDFENYSQESAIVDSVICKCLSNRLRCRLLREPKLDFVRNFIYN